MIEEIFEVLLYEHSIIEIKTSDGIILLEPVLKSDKKKLPMLVATLDHYINRGQGGIGEG